MLNYFTNKDNMKRCIPILLVLFLIFAVETSSLSAQTRYMRVYYIQWVKEGHTGSYGDCIYFEFPGADGVLNTADDENLLVDGGSDSGTTSALAQFLDGKIGVGGTIDHMHLSHPHSDHYNGLRMAVNRYEVLNYYENARWQGGSGYTQLISDLIAEGANMYTFDAGDYLSGPNTDIGPGWDPYISARVLCARYEAEPGGGENADSAVIQIRCGLSSFLTGGDADGSPTENWLVNETPPHSYSGAAAELADTDVYKVHHHGSKYSSYQNFVDQMACGYAVAQMGYGYGPGTHSHPTKEALDRIWSSGGIVYRNDLDGTVLIKCDNLGNFDITRSRAYINETETPGGSYDLVYPPPDIPENLHVTGTGDDFISLDWDDVTGANGYDVFRSLTGNGDPGAGRDANPGCEATGIYEKVNPSNVTISQYTDSDLSPGITYHYRVSAKKIYTQDGYQVCYERRYSSQASAATTGGMTPTPTPYGYHTPSPTPSPIPTATPSPPLPPTPSVTPTPTAGPTPPLGEVVINEILADVPLGDAGDANGDGVRSCWEDEFVELVNRTDHTINLGGCTLNDSYRETYAFPHPFYVSPGQAVVVFGGGTPTGEFGGAIVVTVGEPYGLYLTNTGDTITLRDGEYVYDSLTYGDEGDNDQSLNRDPEIYGLFTFHSEIPGSGGSRYSPGTRINGDPFFYQPTPTPPPTTPTSTPVPTLSPAPTPKPTPRPTLSPPPTPGYLVLASGDYDGDGTSDIALFRAAAGFWAIRGISNYYHGQAGDIPVPGDYDGDYTTDPAVFRRETGLWVIRRVSRIYYGIGEDRPVPADYDGDGTVDVALFRPADGRWAIRGISRFYFGNSADLPAPADWDGDGTDDCGIFRISSGLWASRDLSRVYFGGMGDTPGAGDYDGDGTAEAGVFRPSTGLWASRGGERIYYGRAGDVPAPGHFEGRPAIDIAVFRPTNGGWAIKDITRIYFGQSGDIPVTR